MMIGISPATALVAYKGMIRTVPRNAVQPVTSAPSTETQNVMRRRVQVFGMPGAIVDLVA